MAGVVRREKVAVLSRGTLIDAEMVHSRPDASYIMAGACKRKDKTNALIWGKPIYIDLERVL